eukprot:2634696-Prymnesium_polylepis.1
MDMLETDGPYEGATCGVTSKSGFVHVNNSQVRQWNATLQVRAPPELTRRRRTSCSSSRPPREYGLPSPQFYRELKEKYNTYLTVPDPYWMSGGTNKEPMGYTDAWNHIPTTENGTLECAQSWPASNSEDGLLAAANPRGGLPNLAGT